MWPFHDRFVAIFTPAKNVGNWRVLPHAEAHKADVHIGIAREYQGRCEAAITQGSRRRPYAMVASNGKLFLTQ